MLMFPRPNQWLAVLSPCSDVVAWQPWWQVLHTPVLWQITEICVDLASWLAHFTFQISADFFASRRQILPDLCIERALIQCNLLSVTSDCDDNKLVIFPRPRCFFFLLGTSIYNCFILSPYILLSLLFYFFRPFRCWLAPFFALLSHPFFPLSLSVLTSLAKYLGNEYFLSHRKRF